MMLPITIGLAIISCMVAFAISSCQNWRVQTDVEFSTLLQEIQDSSSIRKSTKSIDSTAVKLDKDLPLPVLHHLQKVLPPHHNDDTSEESSTQNRRIKSLKMEQLGTFLLNGQWIHFTATQLFSASNSNPGFVWEANMRLPLPLWTSVHIGSMGILHVRDSYVKGKGTMSGKFWGCLPIIDIRDTPELNEGELSRWLGESVLFPTSWIPNDNNNEEQNVDKRCKLTWTETSNGTNNAIAVLYDRVSRVQTEIEFRFDTHEDGLLHSIYAMRPYMDPRAKDGVKMLPWEGHFFDYEDQDGVLVPTRIEAGWWKHGVLELYFKGHNTKFVFDRNSGSDISKGKCDMPLYNLIVC